MRVMYVPQIRYPLRRSGARLGILGLGSILTFAAAAGPRMLQPMDPIHAVQALREGGCGGILPPVRTLEHDALLDRAAREWAAGRTLGDATEKSGYQSEKVAGPRITGSNAPVVAEL